MRPTVPRGVVWRAGNRRPHRTLSLLLFCALPLCATGCPRAGDAGGSHTGGGPAGDGHNTTGGGSHHPDGGDHHAPPEKPITFADCGPGPCMLHPGRGRYYTCLSAGGGQCFHFGAPCTPTDQCMFDSASATYHTCRRERGGECLEMGATCQPADGCMFNPGDGFYHTCDQGQGGTCAHFGALCQPAPPPAKAASPGTQQPAPASPSAQPT